MVTEAGVYRRSRWRSTKNTLPADNSPFFSANKSVFAEIYDLMSADMLYFGYSDGSDYPNSNEAVNN